MVEGAERVWISTFHSMCVANFKARYSQAGLLQQNFTIFSESDSDKAIKKILEELNFKDEKFKKVFVRELLLTKTQGSRCKDFCATHACEFSMQDIGKAISFYENYLKKNNALDFDDLLLKTIELFKTCPDVLQHYSNRFDIFWWMNFKTPTPCNTTL